MKETHLFFIRIITENNEYFFSMIYQLEKIQSTTISNIITIVKFLINEYDLFDITNVEFKINEINTEDIIIYDNKKFKNYLKNLIYFDNKINKWVTTSKNKPDYNILKCIKKDTSVRLVLVGNEFDNIVREQTKRESLFDLFELYYHIRPCDVILYKPSSEDGNINVNDIYDFLPNDNKKLYGIILQDGYEIGMIKEFSDKSIMRINTEIFIKTRTEYYKVNSLCDEISFKKINLL